MVKKIIIALIILVIKNSYAEANFYTSIGVANLARGDTLKVSNWSNHFTFFRAPDNGNVIGYSFLLGYQNIINHFILGVNGAYRYFPGPASRSVKLNAINAPRLSSNSNVGLELRPGFLMSPEVALYGILGLESTYYQVQYLLNQTHTTFSNWVYGSGFGIGCDIALPWNFSLMLNYLYIKYQDLNFSDHVAKTNVVVEPNMNIFTLGINYQFLG